MDANVTPHSKTRLGIHYFPDTRHYRESDLHAWLPELQSMGIGWITLVAPLDRAIPEDFLQGLVKAGIDPILHFHPPLLQPISADNLGLLLKTYADWGVRYAIFYDRPNTRSAWPLNAWTQSELVERFLDIYLPAAELTLQSGITPVFPPLEPGGDYWDTAFLRAALQGIQRRRRLQLLRSLVLSAYAFTDDRPLEWGAGGPERWPGARPYFTPPGQQDQRGFYIFDWYLAIAQAVLHEHCQILLFGAGSRTKKNVPGQGLPQSKTKESIDHLPLVRLMLADQDFYPGQGEQACSASGDQLEPVPAEVLACNFWLLAASPESQHRSQAWFQPDGSSLPITGVLKQWFAREIDSENLPPIDVGEGLNRTYSPAEKSTSSSQHPIAHYLLLPRYEWGIAEWHLDVIRPFVKKHQPTIGFSVEEAQYAARVTVVGGEGSFHRDVLEALSRSGCQVERITGDGTRIATQLATR